MMMIMRILEKVFHKFTDIHLLPEDYHMMGFCETIECQKMIESNDDERF